MTDPIHEAWLPAVGWEGLYEVSDLGRVRSLPRKGGNNRWYGGNVLTPYPNKGYPMVPLCRKGKRKMCQVHVLVLTAFVGPCPPGMQGCHGDGNRGDPRLSNLRWDTPAGNMRDQYRHGTRVAGDHHPAAKLSDAEVAEIRRRHAAGVSGTAPPITHRELADIFGISRPHVSGILSGRDRAA